MIAVFMAFGQAIAKDKNEGPVPQDTSWHPGNAKNVKEYFEGKYGKLRDISSTVRLRTYGPDGRLHVGGNITVESFQEMSGEQGRARGLAKAFIEQEAQLFGITNMSEIREYEVRSDSYATGDYVNIFYHRYIGDLELASSRRAVAAARIRVEVGPQDTIVNFDADLVPMSPEAYEATTKKTLPESKIRHIVEMDLRTQKFPKDKLTEAMGRLELKKYAIPDAPYVVCEVKSIWTYIIDAFTGEVLQKLPRFRIKKNMG